MPPLSILAQLILGSLTFLVGVVLLVATDRAIMGTVLLVLGAALEGVMLLRFVAWAKMRKDVGTAGERE